MPYLGNAPTANFASVTKDTFSGNGSTTAFTLSKTATTNGVAVYVENVRQIPTTAYSVSGTTLTFTGTPPSGTNNIYVMHHNTPASTATHPSAQDLTAVNGTFTGDITINDGTAADKKILFDGNAQDYHVGLDDSADSLIIGKGSALGTTSHIVTDANGHVTMPLQTSFLAQPTSVQSNIAANSWVNIVFGTERYDVNGDFASPTFTAPVTGKYMMTFGLDLREVPNDASGLYWVLATSNRTYYAVEDTSDTLAATATNTAYNLSVVADFDANDTCTVMIWYNGTASIDCQTDSFWSGHLLG